MEEIATALDAIRERIALAAAAGGRQQEVQLVAVSKTVAPDRIFAAYQAGQWVFGENRVQEARGKIAALAARMPDAIWHCIGRLQSNKVRHAVEAFSLIESVDSVALASRLNAEAERQGLRLPVLLQVNVTGEASKAGFSPDDVRASIGRLIGFSALDVRGLMTVPPLAQDAEDVRWVFRATRELRDELRDRAALEGLTELSMGMSNDFEVAIEEGATMVRLGRALFGERPSPG